MSRHESALTSAWLDSAPEQVSQLPQSEIKRWDEVIRNAKIPV